MDVTDLVRLDRGGLAAPVSATIFEGRVARLHAPHDPLEYSTGPEHRDAVELQRIVDQLAGIPVTWPHPPGLLRNGAQGKIIGRVLGGRLDGDFAVAQILVTDAEALAAIEAGTLELSLGYVCRLDDRRYQRDISLDHLALVPRARCGAMCALRADAAEGEPTCNCRARDYTSPDMADTGTEVKTESQSGAPETEHADCTCNSRASGYTTGADMEDLQKKLDEALAAVAAEKARADKLEEDLAAAKADAEKAAVDHKVALDNAAADLNKAQTELAAEKEKSAKLDADLQAANARVDGDEFRARVDARVAVITDALKVLKDESFETLSKKSDREIKVAVIKHVDGIDVEADAVDAYVNGMYAGSMRRAEKAASSVVEARETIQEMRGDGANALPTDPAKREAELARQAAARRAERFVHVKKN